jgi:hypothetical protein
MFPASLYTPISPFLAPPFDPPPRANEAPPHFTTITMVFTALDSTRPCQNLAKDEVDGCSPDSGCMGSEGSFTHHHRKYFFEKYFPAREILHVNNV